MRKSVLIINIFILLILLSGNAMSDILPVMENPQTAQEFLDLGDKLFADREFENARNAYSKASKLAQEAGFNSITTEAMVMIARTYLTTDNRQQGREIFAIAMETASPDDPLGWSRYLSVRGRFEWKAGDNQKATETFKEMFYYCIDHKIEDRASDAARMIGITGTTEEQIEWGLKGIKQAEKNNQTSILGPLWNNLGATYEDQNEYKQALEAYLKAKEYHYQHGGELTKCIADWAVAHAYRLNDDFKKAEKLLKPLVRKFEKLNELEFIGWTYKELGHVEMHKEHFDKAAKNFYEARKKLIEVGVRKWGTQYYIELNDLIVNAKIKHDENK